LIPKSPNTSLKVKLFRSTLVSSPSPLNT
jgi:hypothetical protein